MKLKENKGVSLTGFVITILVILLVGAVAGCVYLLNNPVKEKVAVQNPAPLSTLNSSSKVEDKEEVTTNENLYNKIKGTYEYSTKIPNTDDLYFYYELYLNKDGTFCYNVFPDTMEGFCGNYIINDNEIILNQLFWHGSDVGLKFKTRELKLKINSDGSITDSNKYDDAPESSVILKKKTTEVSETLQQAIKGAIKDNAIYTD